MKQHPFAPRELAAIRAAGRARSWTPGETLLPEGASQQDVILIDSGLVKVARQSPNGYTSVLAVRGPGELLGELACLDGRPRSATAVAMRAVGGVSVPAARFLKMLEQDSTLALAVLRSLATRLRESDRLRSDQGAYSSGIRVARILLDISLSYGTPAPAPAPRGAVTVTVTQQELAGAAGTSRESVVRTLRVLHQDGLVVATRGRLLVTDPDRLAQWSAG
ncbi:Crp/Fnr family transcriptional regulator [Streptomyces sp. NPDC006879]|uniref:Crp/Fnr family transcriptional regulator n=1 Tax=Streptomyces sp. NPDC006879 TaxID=3364767 RepID=UPI00368D4780